MEKILVKGDVYTVATKTECKVTSANGTPLGTATAEAPYTFTATTDLVVLSDPDAEFARVNPKYAPAKLRLLGLLGGGASASALPSGYIAAEFVKPISGQTIVHSFPAEQIGEVALEMGNEESQGGAIFAAETTVDAGFQICIVNKKVRFDYGGLVWNAPMVELTKERNRVTFSLETGEYSCNGVSGVAAKVKDFTLKNRVSWFSIFGGYLYGGKLFSAEIKKDGKVTLSFLPCVDEKGVPCMYDKVTKSPFLNSGAGTFIVGLTLKQALKLADLPDGGGELTVSLPWGAQFADTGVPDALQIAADKGWVIKVQYRDGAESERYSRYATCKTVADIAAVNPNFRTDLTADGGWVYPLPELTNLANLAWGGKYSPDMPLKYVDCDAPKVQYTNPGFVHHCQPEWARGDWSGVLNGMWMFGSGSKKALRNVEMVFPKLQEGAEMFGYAVLNKESVLRILGSIPTWTSGSHPLTIGIHVDHEFEEEVAAAIADAEAKRWSVTVQWNGTATAQAASTWGLRRKPIYAKVSTMELPDGTTGQYLSWGHYVTNWEENGYQEFGSVEEAKEHFNISE